MILSLLTTIIACDFIFDEILDVRNIAFQRGKLIPLLLHSLLILPQFILQLYKKTQSSSRHKTIAAYTEKRAMSN